MQAYSGDGGPAIGARIALPAGIAFDRAGNLYFADTGNLRIRGVNTTGIVQTVAGDGTVQLDLYGAIGDGGPAINAGFSQTAAPFFQGVAVDSSGNLYVSDVNNHRVRKVNPGGIISTVAGGPLAPVGDGGLATSAGLIGPTGLAVDSAGNLYIADATNARIRKVDKAGIISTVAGNGSLGFTGEGTVATSSPINAPVGLAIDAKGNIYFSEVGNALIGNGPRVRKVDPSGILTTVAGNGTAGFSGDGGQATNAQLASGMEGLAVDNAGNLYIADYGNSRIRKVDPAGIITTVAGTGQSGVSSNGDGGLASNARLQPAGLALDASGNLYVSDYSASRIRKITLGAPPFSVSATALFFSSNFDIVPASQTLTVSSAGLPLTFTITTTTSSGGEWLIAGTTGNTQQPIAVSILGGLPAGTYKGAITITPTTPGYTPITVAVTLNINATIPAKPTINTNGVVNGASFQPGIVGNSVLTILGANLASTTDTWNNAISGGHLPESLDGVTVTFNGKPAYLIYISPTQINLLSPDVGSASVSVVVNNNGTLGVPYSAQASPYGPAFFAWPGNQPVATRQDFSYAAKPGTFPGTTTIAAKPGDVLILWGTGFGATTPSTPLGVVVPSDQSYSTTSLPTVAINNIPALVYGAALSPGYAGLYQVAFQVPASLPDGDWPVVATIGGVSSPSGLVLSVRK